MNRPELKWWSLIAGVLCAAHAVFFLCVASIRAWYPFELEWMEGHLWHLARRAAEGLPLYHAPTTEHIPLLYPPLYPIVSSWLLPLAPDTFVVLRLLSCAATLGSLFLIYAVARGIGATRTTAWLSAGLWLSTYRLSGTWFDLARIDPLFLALCLLGLLASLRAQGLFGNVLAGVSFALAVHTKQTAVAIALPTLAVALWGGGRRAWAGPIAFVAVAVGASELWRAKWGEWYELFVLEMPGQHGLSLAPLPDALRDALWIGPLIPITGMVAWRWRSWLPNRALRTTAAFAAGAWAASVASRLHVGGYENVLMPLHSALALTFAAAVVLSAEQTLQRRVAMVCVTAQLAIGFWPRQAVLPSANDRLAGEELQAFIASEPGEVLSLTHSYLAVRAGKAPSLHSMAMFDFSRGAPAEVRAPFFRTLAEELASAKWSAILLPTSTRTSVPEKASFIEAFYDRVEPFPLDPDLFFPVTGARARAETLLRPRR